MVQDQIRTVKDALESRIGVRIDKEENVTAWLVTRAAETTNKYHIAVAKGCSAYEKWKGRKYRLEMVEFGESVLYKTPGLKRKDKLEVRWQDGIFLGVNDTS